MEGHLSSCQSGKWNFFCFFLSCLFFLALSQTEMTAEERRKKHQLELKEQLHEEAKVFYWILFASDIFSINFWCGFGGVFLLLGVCNKAIET